MRIHLIFAIILMLSMAASAQEQKVIIYPVEAISDSAELGRAEFQKRYPGIDVTDFGLMDEGWYVRYTHELLTYVYGPIDELDEARIQKKILEEIRLSLVLKNPKLSTSKVDIIRFDFGLTPDMGEVKKENG